METLGQLPHGAMTMAKGTKWVAFNAVTEYADHYLRFTGKSGSEAAQRRAVLAIEPGKVQDLKTRTLALLK